MHVIDTLKCYMDITPGNPTIWYMGEKLEGFDAVIPRIGASVTHYGLAVIRQFEMTGVYCLTESVALGRSRDKLRALQLLSRKGLGLPRTSLDRKSTRLNSSHVAISYAVFCLKKKKPTTSSHAPQLT